jgi:hypothetical protein
MPLRALMPMIGRSGPVGLQATVTRILSSTAWEGDGNDAA